MLDKLIKEVKRKKRKYISIEDDRNEVVDEVLALLESYKERVLVNTEQHILPDTIMINKEVVVRGRLILSTEELAPFIYETVHVLVWKGKK